jgi:hypothetical protein
MEPQMNLSQQHKLFDVALARPVTVIGAGAVGGYAVLGLAKLGIPRITVYDHDHVESHNVPMSVYGPDDLARLKVEALRDIVRAGTGTVIETRPRRYEGERLEGAVVCCVDTMEARQAVWKAVELQPDVNILIDTRVSAELVWVFAVDPCDPDDAERYRHHLAYSTKETAAPMCGSHGVVYVSMRAASAACANLTSWWQHGRKTLHHRELAGALEQL